MYTKINLAQFYVYNSFLIPSKQSTAQHNNIFIEVKYNSNSKLSESDYAAWIIYATWCLLVQLIEVGYDGDYSEEGDDTQQPLQVEGVGPTSSEHSHQLRVVHGHSDSGSLLAYHTDSVAGRGEVNEFIQDCTGTRTTTPSHGPRGQVSQQLQVLMRNDVLDLSSIKPFCK